MVMSPKSLLSRKSNLQLAKDYPLPASCSVSNLTEFLVCWKCLLLNFCVGILDYLESEEFKVSEIMRITSPVNISESLPRPFLPSVKEKRRTDKMFILFFSVLSGVRKILILRVIIYNNKKLF